MLHYTTLHFYVLKCNTLPSTPFYSSLREIITDNFDALYAQLKPKGVTVSAMLAKAVAEVLKKHPIVNAAYVEGGIKYNKGTESTITFRFT